MWISLFFAVTWTIWEFRNGKVFGNEEALLSKAVDMVQFRIAWWFKNFGKGSKDPITHILLDVAERCIDPYSVRTPNVEEWIPPPQEMLKFNVDGSARGSPGQAGIGGVLRDSGGKVLCTFSLNMGWQDAITAEVLALAKACELCLSRNELAGKTFVFSSDSKAVVSWVNSYDLGNIRLTHFLYEIRSNLRRLGNASVEFSYRSSNSFADSLAKKASSGEGDAIVWSLL